MSQLKTSANIHCSKHIRSYRSCRSNISVWTEPLDSGRIIVELSRLEARKPIRKRAMTLRDLLRKSA